MKDLKYETVKTNSHLTELDLQGLLVYVYFSLSTEQNKTYENSQKSNKLTNLYLLNKLTAFACFIVDYNH